MKVTLTFDSYEEFEQFTSGARLGSAIMEAAEKQGKTIKEPVKAEEKAAEPEPKAEEKKAVSAEEVRAKLNELAKEKGKEAVKGLFKSFGAANFTKIKPEDYEAVLKAAEEGLNG